VIRVQRKRTKGWRMPAGAVYVGRPSLWGNPWTLAEMGAVYGVPIAERPAAAVRMYRRELEHWGLLSDYHYLAGDVRYDAASKAADESGARNMAEYAPVALRDATALVCWCPLDRPCHADVLIELITATAEPNEGRAVPATAKSSLGSSAAAVALNTPSQDGVTG
jgi:hypothetical protein